jgi:hypothetical protein
MKAKRHQAIATMRAASLAIRADIHKARQTSQLHRMARHRSGSASMFILAAAAL